MSISPALFSSKTDDHPTPQDLFDDLHREFNFVLDVAASKENAKCPTYLTKEQNALEWDWAALAQAAGGGAVFCNPPYSRSTGDWVRKAAKAAMDGATVVCLLPARTDTRWFHDVIWNGDKGAPQYGVEVLFIRGRLKFGGSKNSAPFPSMIVVFHSVTHL